MSSSAYAPSQLRRADWLRLAYWVVPSLFCLVVYFWGIRAWYQQDDFVWLGQRLAIHNFHDFLHALFAPSIHGTFRPLSERLFLLIAGSAFGADAFPARLVVFLTQIANVLVLSSVAKRITNSYAAGFMAPILWVANGALAFPMTWSSSYMYILCGLCILLAFRSFLNYIDTGNRNYLYLQWAIFLAGFGVMETMVVYPAIVATYSFLCARKQFWKTVPLFGGSAAFLVFHSLYVPKQHAGTYSLHLDLSLPHTLLTYWKWVLVPNDWLVWARWPSKHPWTAPGLIVLFTAAIVVYVAFTAWRGNRTPAFGLAAFFILLAPVVPLTEHVSYYYLTLPAMGIALVGACAAASAARAGRIARVAACVVLGLFLVVQAPFAAFACKWWYQRSQQVRDAVLGAAAVRRAMPEKTLVLTGVDETIFAGAFWDHAFQTFDTPGVYIDPSERSALLAANSTEDLDLPSMFLDAADLQRGLLQHRVEVLSVAGTVPIDVTPRFEAAAQTSAPLWPTRVDVANSLAEPYLRGAWYQLETDHRWMGGRAGVILAGPSSPNQKLVLHGYCSHAELEAGPLAGKVTVDGKPAGELDLAHDGSFETAFALPLEAIGKPSVEVMLEVGRTFRPPGDGRNLGLSFGSFEVR